MSEPEVNKTEVISKLAYEGYKGPQYPRKVQSRVVSNKLPVYPNSLESL